MNKTGLLIRFKDSAPEKEVKAVIRTQVKEVKRLNLNKGILLKILSVKVSVANDDFVQNKLSAVVKFKTLKIPRFAKAIYYT